MESVLDFFLNAAEAEGTTKGGLFNVGVIVLLAGMMFGVLRSILLVLIRLAEIAVLAIDAYARRVPLNLATFELPPVPNPYKRAFFLMTLFLLCFLVVGMMEEFGVSPGETDSERQPSGRP